MSRRIALVIIGLVAALLILAVVPLGLSLTTNERASFRFAVESSARQLGAQAEEHLADHNPPTAMNEAKPIIARWACPITQSVKWTSRLTGITAWADPCMLTTR